MPLGGKEVVEEEQVEVVGGSSRGWRQRKLWRGERNREVEGEGKDAVVVLVVVDERKFMGVVVGGTMWGCRGGGGGGGGRWRWRRRRERRGRRCGGMVGKQIRTAPLQELQRH